jgi:TPM domain
VNRSRRCAGLQEFFETLLFGESGLFASPLGRGANHLFSISRRCSARLRLPVHAGLLRFLHLHFAYNALMWLGSALDAIFELTVPLGQSPALCGEASRKLRLSCQCRCQEGASATARSSSSLVRTAEGKKELVGLADGIRESAQLDQANVLTAQSRSGLESKLKDFEDKSRIQLVVATVKSLNGNDIETYANGLFRFWKLGQAQKNNGVLLVVAPAEHKVRIEVGYGLEGTLTDALSSVIIASAILPRFKAGDFSGGIERGVDGIISVLSGDTADWQAKVELLLGI